MGQFIFIEHEATDVENIYNKSYVFKIQAAQSSVSIENVGNRYNNAVIRMLLTCSILSKPKSLVYLPKTQRISFHYTLYVGRYLYV